MNPILDPDGDYEEQVAGLGVVLDHLNGRPVNVGQFYDPGDVVYLAAVHTPSQTKGPTEVVYKVGQYDLWRNGSPMSFGVSAEVAAQTLVDDYMAAKNKFVAARKSSQNVTDGSRRTTRTTLPEEDL